MQQAESQPHSPQPMPPAIVYHLDFHESHLLITSQHNLSLYDLINKKLVWMIEVRPWMSIMLKETGYVAWIQINDRKTINIMEVSSGKKTAQITLKEPIQQIKSSRGCLAAASLTHLSVLHFPTLRPIYHAAVGNSIGIVFDISFEGLVLVHSGQDRGKVQVNNFTAKNKEQAVSHSKIMPKSGSHKNMLAIRADSNVNSAYSHNQRVSSVARSLFHSISAHQDSISCLVLSPNGLRFISSSKKGTVLRVFSTVTGERLTEFRMSFQVGRIGDMSFDVDGGVLGCLNQKNVVNLFNVQMSQEEEISESTRKGFQIYQQQNPKSFFSFLSYFHSNLANQYPFAYFTLVKPEVTAQQVKIREEKQEQPKQSQNQKSNKEIIQVHEIQQSQIQFGSIVDDQKQSSPNAVGKTNSGRGQQSFLLKTLQPKPQLRRTRSSAKPVRQQSGSLLNLLRKSNLPAITQLQSHPYYTYCSRLHISTNSSIWIVKGNYLYELKYDPFHGGEMMQSQTIEMAEVRKWPKA